MTDPTDRPADRPHRPTDQVATDQRPTTDHAPDPAPLTVEAAAIALGITANAVRQRMKRGTLAGEKTAGGWVVWLPTDQATTPLVGRSVADQPTTPDRPTTDRPRPTSAAGVNLAPLAELIERQGDEIGRLREAAAIWQVRAMQAEDRLKQITAGDVTPQDATAATPVEVVTVAGPVHESAPWWRRLWERR